MKDVLKWVKDRVDFSEPSTWRGAVGILTAFGLTISPEQSAAIVAFGLGLSGLIAVFNKDRQK
jgi:hypothetical protein